MQAVRNVPVAPEPVVEELGQRSWLYRVTRRIIQWVKKVFNYLAFWREAPSPIPLAARQWVQRHRRKELEPQEVHSGLNDSIKNVVTIAAHEYMTEHHLSKVAHVVEFIEKAPETLAPFILGIVQFLGKNETIAQVFYAHLTEGNAGDKLRERCAEALKDHNDVKEPLLSWLFDRTKLSFTPELSKALETATAFLINNELHSWTNTCNQMMEEAVNPSLNNITKEVSERILALLEKQKPSDLNQNFCNAFSRHLKIIYEKERATSSLKGRLKAMRSAVAIGGYTDAERLIEAQYRDDLRLVEQKGEEAFIQIKILKVFKQHAFSYPVVQDVADMLQRDPKSDTKSVLKSEIKRLVNGLVSTLFPEADGGIAILEKELNQLNDFLTKIQKLKNLMLLLHSEKSLKCVEPLKKLLARGVRYYLVHVATEVIHKEVSNLVEPKRLKSFCAKNIFSAVHGEFINYIVRAEACGSRGAGLNELAGIINKDTQIEKAYCDSLAEKALDSLSCSRAIFAAHESCLKARAKILQMADPRDEDLKNIDCIDERAIAPSFIQEKEHAALRKSVHAAVESFIAAIKVLLRDYQKAYGPPCPEAINELLKEYCCPKRPVDKLFDKLFTSLIFDFGSFGGDTLRLLYTLFVERSFGQALADATADLRTSFPLIEQRVSDALKSYAHPETIRQLFEKKGNEKSDSNDGDTGDLFQWQVRRLAAVIHDSILIELSWVPRRLVSLLLGPNENELARIINNIFNRLFSDPQANLNFFFGLLQKG